MPSLRGRKGLFVVLALAVVSAILFIQSSKLTGLAGIQSNRYVAIVDDYTYTNPSTVIYNDDLPWTQHDTDVPNKGSKWTPTSWKPSAWLPDLPFLGSSQKHHLPDGKRGRVLVTGGAGSIGIPLVERLLKEGFAVTLHDLRNPLPEDVKYIRERSPQATKGGRLTFVKGDIQSARHLNALMEELMAPTAAKKGKGKTAELGAGGGLVGIVNLAGVARDIWCSSRLDDCGKANVKGTTNLFEALVQATQSISGKKPWFLHVSSLDVYSPATREVATGSMDDLTALGRTKLLAERELETVYVDYMDHLLNDMAKGAQNDRDGIRTLILRPSTVYGSSADLEDRLVPALIRNALADLPVQILHGDSQVDFLHIDDAMDGFVRAIERLKGEDEIKVKAGGAVDAQLGDSDSTQDLSSTDSDIGDAAVIPGYQDTSVRRREASPGLPLSVQMQRGQMFETLDLVSGFTTTPKQLLHMIVSLTQSVSPIQDLTTHKQIEGGKGAKTPLMAVDVSTDTRSKLGFQAAISLDQGIAGYVNSLRQGSIDWAKDYLGAECPSSPLYGDPQVVPAADRRNKNLQRLAGCTANIGVNHNGWMHHVKCGGSSCGADNIKANSFNWNQSIFTILPAGQSGSDFADRTDGTQESGGNWGWAFGLLGSNTKQDGQPVQVQFEERNTRKVLGFQRDMSGAGDRYVKLALISREAAETNVEITTVFEPRVAANASQLQFVIPGTEEYLAVEPELDTNKFYISYLNTASRYDFRMTLLCCPTDRPWPLLLDDYETADFRYGSTGDIPFDISKRSHECRRVEMALDRMESFISRIPNTNEINSVDPIDAIRRPLAATISRLPHDWVLRELPTCMNHCENPVKCVQTGHCRCIATDECPTKRANPLTPLELPTGNKLISITTNADFVKAVGNLRWQDVILPSAMRVMETFPDLIKVHVVSGYENEEAIEAADCHKLQTKHCFSADSILYRAMRTISVKPEEADLIILPVYQHCDGAPFLLHDVMKYATQTVPNLINRPVSLTLTHDWGICEDFAWNVWEARERQVRPDWILDNIFVWSVMGDTVTNCYRPHMDTVIPARTCNSEKLRKTFGDIVKVKPIAQRPKLLTWSGTMWGTGKSARMRLACQRGGVASEELVTNGGPQSSFLNWDYMHELTNSRFCPQPTGIAGWSFRVQDAIYAGCIPVFMSEGTHYPYADILDYSKFSVRISPNELDHVEQILRAFPLEKVESMQAHLVTARDAFLYSGDEDPDAELQRKGPLWFALQSARIRINTGYPSNITLIRE
ncbi:hypothetical protein QFC21_005816 [Naganishia friedmannii]|uniref:Uncharacterized protein n=1 Tax=Naganishia friedmannii TaxID=89922 RepID=A0ACC2V7A2_9TREE|nr:hypothetical protein QFC21_005816 [Naganishia friedmannii]